MLRVNTTIRRSIKSLLRSKTSLYAAANASSKYSTSYEEWKKLAKSQLKEKPAESLISKTAEVNNIKLE